MHRRTYAHCTIKLTFTATSPLLIQGEKQKDGHEKTVFYNAVDPKDGKTKECVPASSIKGVWRSGAETILRSVEAGLVCNPFEEKAGSAQSCSKRLEARRFDDIRDTPGIYQHLCPVCRIFGSTAHAGLIQISDGWIEQAVRMDRTGIAIDRFTGGVKQGALYTVAPLAVGTTFPITVHIDNFEFWHLGLLALIYREMSEGRMRLGSGTRNGLGRIQVDWESVRFRYPNHSNYDQLMSPQRGLVSSQALAQPEDSIGAPTSERWLIEQMAPLASTDWRDSLWRTYEVADRTDLTQLQKFCVEEALASRLKAGTTGFAYTRMEGEMKDAS